MIVHKLGGAAVLLAVAVAACVSPHILRKHFKKSSVAFFINPIACGAFLGLIFFHLLPEIVSDTQIDGIGFQIGQTWFDLSYLFMFTGFMSMLAIEKVFFVVEGCKHACEVGSVGVDDDNCQACHEESTQCGLDKIHITSEKNKSTLSIKSCSSGASNLPVTEKRKCVVVPEKHVSGKIVEEAQIDSLSPIGVYLTIVALAIHSLLEGLVTGLLNEPRSFWITDVSIAVHKYAVGFALASKSSQNGFSGAYTRIYLGIFCIASPIGILLSFCFSKADPRLNGILQSLCLGVIIYIAIHITFEEFDRNTNLPEQVYKFGLTFAGAGLIMALLCLNMVGEIPVSSKLNLAELTLL